MCDINSVAKIKTNRGREIPVINTNHFACESNGKTKREVIQAHGRERNDPMQGNRWKCRRISNTRTATTAATAAAAAVAASAIATSTATIKKSEIFTFVCY